MNTRSQSKGKENSNISKKNVIEIDEQSKFQEVKDFEEDSDVYNRYSSQCSSQSASQDCDENQDVFRHLAPPEDPKKQKLKLQNFKHFFFESKTVDAMKSQENSQKQNKDNNKQQSENEEPLSPQISDPELLEQFQMSMPKKKPKLMQELQEELNKPINENDLQEIDAKRLQRKREAKKRDYLIEKKYKQFKEGKKKDKVSNQVFNAIEDFFM